MSVVGQAFVEVLPLSTGFAGSLQRQLQTQVNAASTAVNKSMTGLQSIGRTVTLGLAVGTLAVVGASVKAATSFDSLTTTLVTGAGESQKNLEMVRQGILKLAPAMGTSATDLTNGLYMIESAGFHGAAGLDILKAAAEGAKVGNADLATVANAVTTALTDYHLPASQATAVTSMLVETVASGKTHMQDLAGALSSVLPVAAAAHINLAQVTGALATMTAQGISAQEAGQNVANTIRSLQNPSHEAIGVLNQFGVNVSDLTQNLGQRGLTGSLQVLVEAIGRQMGPSGMVLVDTFKQSQSAAKDAQVEFANLPPALRGIGQAVMAGTISQSEYRKALKGMSLDHRELISQLKGTVDQTRGFSNALKSGTPQAQTMGQVLSQMLGGATGLNTALALTGPNMTTFQANVQNITAAGKNGATTVQGFALVQKDFGFQVQQGKAAVGALFIQLGEHLIPVLQRGIAVVVTAVHWLTEHKTVALALAGVIGGALLTVMGAYVVLIAGKFLSAIGRAASSIGSLVTKMLGMGSAATASAAEQEAAGVTTEATTAALSASIDSLNVSVQTLVATLGGELPAALDVVATAEEETAAISESTGGGLGPMGIAIGAIVIAATLLATHWKQVWGVVKEVAGEAWHWIDKNVVQPVMSVVEPAIKGIVHVVQDVVNGIETAFTAVEDWFKKWWPILLPIVMSLFLGPLGLLIGVVVDEIILHWHTLLNITKEVFSAIAGAVADVFHFIDSVAHAVIGPFVPFISDAWHYVLAVTSLVWDLVKTYFMVWWDIVRTIFTVQIAIIQGVLSEAWNVIRSVAQIIWDGLKAYFLIWWDVLRAIVEVGWALIKGLFTVALDLIEGKWGAAWNAIRDTFSTVFNIIWGTVQSIWGNISGFFTGALNTFTGFWSSTWNTIASTFTNIWGGISSGISGIWGGISAGISAGIRDVENIINSIFINPINTVLGVFGVHVKPFNTSVGGGGGGGGSNTALGTGGSQGGMKRAAEGMVVNEPTVLVGEGRRRYPEWVIPSDPMYRGRAHKLLGSLMAAIGVPGMQSGGVISQAQQMANDAVKQLTGGGGNGFFGLGVGPNVGPNVVGLVTGTVGGIVGGVEAALGFMSQHVVGPVIDEAAKEAEDAVRHIPPAVIGTAMAGIIQAAANGIKSMLGADKGGKGNIPSGQHKALIDQALSMAGISVDAADESAVNVIVTHESGWNPQAINNTDINAQHGDPSRGLMQTIGSTFEAYRLPGLADNIYDPLANLVAGIRYAVSRYGTLTNVPGVANVSRGGAYVGYDNGGWLMPGVTVAVNNTGRPEPVLSPRGAGPPGSGMGGITLMPGAVNVRVELTGDTSGAGVEQLVERGVQQGVTEALNDVLYLMGGRNPASTARA